jgi:prepilin-type N-terminal cleavage/methylation domain-containing protein
MKKGFSLIEILIVISLFTVIVGFALWAFVMGLRAWNSGQNRAEIRLDATYALERMVREISQASNIGIAQDDTVKFSADVNNNGVNETITYKVVDNNLIRSIPDLLLEDIILVVARSADSLQLVYYDLDNNLLTPPIIGAQQDTIRLIQITLNMNKADETLTLSSSAYARNQ